MKNFKPLYATGLFVLALYGLTSFNPLSVSTHLAYLQESVEGSASFASDSDPQSAETKPVEVKPVEAKPAAHVQPLDAKPTDGKFVERMGLRPSSAHTGTFSNYLETSDKSAYKVNRSGKGFFYEADSADLKIVEFRKVGDNGIGGKSKVEISYEISPTREFGRELQSCRNCQDLLSEKHTVALDMDYDTLIEALRTNKAEDQGALIKSRIEEDFASVKTALLEAADEDIEKGCQSENYFDAKECFVKRFELAKDCARSNSRSRSRDRDRDERPSRGRASTRSETCRNAEDIERVREDFQTWITELALEDETSDRRLENLKSVDNDSATDSLIDKLIEQRELVKKWASYNKQYAARMKELTEDLNSATDPIQRKQIVLEIEGGAQKYQRFYTAAFESDALSDLPRSAAKLLEDRTNTIQRDYEKVMKPFKAVINNKFLKINGGSSIAEVDRSRVDISQLTDARNGRGQISGYDYNSLRENFTYQGTVNQNGQRQYNSNDPYLTQSMPNSRFNAPNTANRNWQNWRVGGTNNNYQPQYQPQYQQSYQQQQYYQPRPQQTNYYQPNSSAWQTQPRYY